MYLGVEANGVVTINLYGTQQACLTACIDIDGNPKIGLFNKQGNSVLSAGISDEIGQGVQISNAEGVPVCFIQVPGDGIPRIELLEVASPTLLKKFWSTPLPKRKRKTSTRTSRTKK